MKSSKKVLAFALAAAMVVTAVPATNAQAASTAKLSAKKATVYSAGYKTVTVTTPKSWKSVKVTATSNKKSVATVKKTAAKKIKVTGVKPGTAKVTVKVTYKTSTKKNAKAKTKKLTYTMKVAKVGVALSGESVVAVGSTTKLTNTKKNSSRAKITYTSSDDSIATVAADGTVTGVKAGKATITAKITVGKDSATTTKDVEVKNYVLSTVAQNKLTELTATVTGNTKNLKASDFTVKSEATNVVYPVSKVTVDSKDASKVTLTLFSELKDAATYDVTLDGITKTFVASDGKVASIALDTATIPYATETEVKLVSKDANGVIVKELKYGEADNSYAFTIDTKGNGYTNGSKLYLNKVGDTAEATVEYKTGKYDQNGKPEGNIGPNKVTITAVDQSAVNNFAVKVVDSLNAKFDDAKDTNKVAANDTGKYACFMIKNADGKEIDATEYAKYTVESSDNTVLMLVNNTLTNKTVKLTPLKSGTAYILIKKDDKVVGSVAIEVGAERTVASLELDKYNVTLSNSIKDASGLTVADNKVVKTTLKDQYGDDISGDLVVECLSTDAKNIKSSDVTANAGSTYYSVSGKNVTFYSGVTKGNYVYKISYKKDGKEVVAKTVSVTVKETTGSTPTAWRVNVTNENADITVGKYSTTQDGDITVSMYGTKDGVDVKKETAVTYIVKDKDGKVIFDNNTSATAVTNDAIDVFGGELKVNALTVTPQVNTAGAVVYKDAVKNLSAGTYSVTAVYAKSSTQNITMSTSFNIKDNQAEAKTEIKSNKVKGEDLAAVLNKALIVKYGNKVYSNADDVTSDAGIDIYEVEVKTNTGVTVKNEGIDVSGYTFLVKNLKVWVEVADGMWTPVSVSVPNTITAE